ncbi:Mg-chelatase subunit ChlD [Lachnospiraceae bacterium NE2001]|nr:Mg-chelatase subunit ChlD [Lachnospiraceae bacterium NE2001]
MTFASLLPLIALVGVPIIIILYLMKPKGVRKVVPSVLLWKNAERNERSTTFSKKLIKNILMFIEILALLFLMLAAMSPAIKRNVSGSSKSTILVIDTTGSMQFQDEGTDTRFESAIRDAKDFVETSSGEVSIISCGETIEVLANKSRDKQKLKRLLSGIKPTDTSGDIRDAEGIMESLECEDIIVFTDGAGAANLKDITSKLSLDIKVYGKPSSNAGLTQMSMKKNADGLYDIAVGYQTKGVTEASFDITLYDAEGSLLDVRSISLSEDSSNTILSLGKDVKGDYVRAELTGFGEDGLSRDNTAYAVKTDTSLASAYFVGAGNTFYEKAYQAVAGEAIVKVTSDSDVPDAEKNVLIYDKAELVTKNKNRLVQAYHPKDANVKKGAIVTVKTGDLINDMSDYTFGASNLYELDCPEWAEPLMVINEGTEDETVVAYYGEHDGVRQVVLGFDIRDSEYPLMAEFPIFVADSLTYLTDDSLVREKYLQAGESLSLSPSVSSNMKLTNLKGIAADLSEADIYKLEDSGKTEYFVTRFPSSEGDGTQDIQSMSYIKQADYGVRFGSLKKICLVIALLLIILDWIIYIRRKTHIKKPELIWRVVLTAFVVLSIIGVNLPGRKHKTTTIFLVDMSDSNIGSLQLEEDYLREKIKELPLGESYGIVTFGRNAITDQFVSSENEYYGLATNPDGTATNIEDAAAYAISLIPDNRLGRVVVLTDGKETVGDIGAVKDKLEKNDVELCGLLFEADYGKDVYIQNVDMPDKMATGDAYSIKVTVYSTYETSATLKLWDGSNLEEDSKVKLTKGENTFVLNNIAGDASIEQKTVTIEADGDTVSENNSMISAALVDAPEKILIISGVSEDSSGLVNILESLNKDVTVVSALSAPNSITEVLKYQTIILDDCHINDMPEELPLLLQTFVRDYGGGLICTGGRESYAPGGYKDTVLEEILPVDMTPKGIDEAPSLAMVMVIDCSGSMDSAGYDPITGQSTGGRKKIDVAVDAAKEAVNTLTRNDYVGVVAFSDRYEWKQKLVKVEDKEAIKDKIETLGIMGGTVIKPAVIEAANALKSADAGVKHILLLTDGEGETTDFNDAIDLINDNNITMSTIAIGSDSDTSLLERLADECGGRYYYSDSSTDVPKIFAEEVYLSGTAYYKNGDFSLYTSNSNLVSGLYEEGISNITGYIATSTKSGAREVITTCEDDPLLSSWQYGLGHSVALMTTASGDWNESLASQQDYLEMWKRILDYTSMENDLGKDAVSVYKRRGKIEISYTASSYSEDTSLVGVYTSPSGVSEELALEPGEPGNYTAAFEPKEMGVYTINIHRKEGDDIVASTTALETLEFSDEYRRDISNANFISFVEQYGRMLETDTKLYTKVKGVNQNKRDITDIIIVLAIILLLIDIVIRRFDLSRLLVRGSSVNNSGSSKLKSKKEVPAQTVNTVTGSGQQVSESTASGGGGFTTNAQNLNVQSSGNPGANNQTADSMIPNTAGKKNKKAKKQTAQEPVSAGLDTTTLLQKKKDRNLH